MNRRAGIRVLGEADLQFGARISTEVKLRDELVACFNLILLIVTGVHEQVEPLHEQYEC